MTAAYEELRLAREAVRAAESALARYRAQKESEPDLVWLLGQILGALPENRDWLDPVLEKAAQAAVAKAKVNA